MGCRSILPNNLILMQNWVLSDAQTAEAYRRIKRETKRKNIVRWLQPSGWWSTMHGALWYYGTPWHRTPDWQKDSVVLVLIGYVQWQSAWNYFKLISFRLWRFWWKSIKICYRESARRRADRLTYRQTDAKRFYNLPHAICYMITTTLRVPVPNICRCRTVPPPLSDCIETSAVLVCRVPNRRGLGIKARHQLVTVGISDK